MCCFIDVRAGVRIEEERRAERPGLAGGIDLRVRLPAAGAVEAEIEQVEDRRRASSRTWPRSDAARVRFQLTFPS